MFHQIQQAIEPRTALKQVITGWGQVCRDLSEASRKRKPQMENYALLG